MEWTGPDESSAQENFEDKLKDCIDGLTEKRYWIMNSAHILKLIDFYTYSCKWSNHYSSSMILLVCTIVSIYRQLVIWFHDIFLIVLRAGRMHWKEWWKPCPRNIYWISLWTGINNIFSTFHSFTILYH